MSVLLDIDLVTDFALSTSLFRLRIELSVYRLGIYGIGNYGIGNEAVHSIGIWWVHFILAYHA